MSDLNGDSQSRKKKKPVFIRLLEYGEEIGLTGTDVNKAIEWGIKSNILPGKNDEEFPAKKEFFKQLFYDCYVRPGGVATNERILKTEYYFRLIEYQELQEARKASKSANRNSFIAITVSILAIIISIYMAYSQINSPVSIDQKQIEAITNRPLKLDQEQMETIKGWINQRQPAKPGPPKKTNH
jgi:hypothetical protein